MKVAICLYMFSNTFAKAFKMQIGLSLSLEFFQPFLKIRLTLANLKTDGKVTSLTETLNGR